MNTRTPAGDRAALAEGLRAGLQGVAARPQTPEQDYLIGLAYLNGIDVEMDKNRAADLITAAAGTYTRLTEISRELADRYGSMGLLSCLRFGYERMEYVATLENRPEEGERCCLRELDVIRRLSKAEGYESTPEYQTVSRYIAPQRDIADCYVQMGVTNKFQGKPDKAREYLLKGLEASQGACEGGTPQARRRVAVAYANLGQLSLGKALDEARDYLLKALEICRQLYEETGTAAAKRDLAITYNQLGCVSLGVDETMDYFLKSLELLKGVSEHPAYQGLAAAIYYSLSRVCKDRSKAKEYCLRGLELSKMTGFQLYCSQGHRHLAAILAEEGEPRRAVEHYEKALRMAEELHRQDSLNREFEEEMAKNSFEIGLLAQWDPALQKEMLTQAYDVWTRLSERLPEAPECARQRDRARAELDRLAGQG